MIILNDYYKDIKFTSIVESENMKIARNIWRLILCALIVKSCCRGEEPPLKCLSSYSGDGQKIKYEKNSEDYDEYIKCKDTVKDESFESCHCYPEKLHEGRNKQDRGYCKKCRNKFERCCEQRKANKHETDCKDCELVKNCMNPKNENKDTVTLGKFIVSFVLGLLVGQLILTLVCVCCPTTHVKATRLLSAASRRGDKSVSPMTLSAARVNESMPRSATADVTGNKENVYNEPDFYNKLDNGCHSVTSNNARALPAVPEEESSDYNHLNTVSATPKQAKSKIITADIHVSNPSYSFPKDKVYQQCIPSRIQTESYSNLQLDGCSGQNPKSEFDTPAPNTIVAEEPHDYFVLEATSDRVFGSNPVPRHEKTNMDTAGLDPQKTNTDTAGLDPHKTNTDTAGFDRDKTNKATAGLESDKTNMDPAGCGPNKICPETSGHEYFVLELPTTAK